MQGNLYVGVSAQVACRSVWRPSPTTSPMPPRPASAPRRCASRPCCRAPAASRSPMPPPGRPSCRASGEIVRTDNPFDVAVEGDAWLAIQTPAGAGLHARRPHAHDRRPASCRRSTAIPCSMPAARPSCSTPTAARRASPATARSSRTTARSARIGLFKIDDKRQPHALRELRRHSRPACDARWWISRTTGMQQGFVERANVNPVMEMTQAHHR